ncbi:MAG: hypothetical protein JRF72_09960 [Deltaproteobacteria bacterium]|jgi:hypothetical protein|nr:hypothetical protein [Deltaproteobacteria bacterium]
MQPVDANELIQEIRRHELVLAKMYKQFARSHPHHRQFWSRLAHEEAMHAMWIKTLGQHFENGIIGLSEFKMSHQAIKTSIAHLERQTEASKNGNLSLLNAVTVALDIEKSMIDKKIFNIFDLAGVKNGRIRAGLESETARHRQSLEKLYSELSEE